MYCREILCELEDYFKDFSMRKQNGTYFCRLDSYNEEIGKFLIKYLTEARANGIYILGKIPNPDERQLGFYEEIAGLEFQLNAGFIRNTLKLWLPRLDLSQRALLADAVERILAELSAAGKNQDMIKNAFIKFMCWFYYKLDQVVSAIGKGRAPKILYEGTVSNYELKLMRILAESGCDILLLEREGDQGYLASDAAGRYSQMITRTGAGVFPKELVTAELGRSPAAASVPVRGAARPSAAGGQPGAGSPPAPAAASSFRQQSSQPPAKAASAPVSSKAGPGFRIQTEGMMGTNIWISGGLFENCEKAGKERGTDPAVYYNMFVRIRGAEDRAEYDHELLRWKLKMDTLKKKMVIVERQIPMPEVAEVSKVRRRNYDTRHQLLADLLMNISYPKCTELENLIKKAFIELIGEEEDSLQITANRAVCMVCWLNRYIPELFEGWKLGNYPVFVFFGACTSENEVMFLRLLSRIPADVFVICPDLGRECRLKDQHLFDKTFEFSLEQRNFPAGVEDVSFRTTAYNAEQDLNGILYQDTGMYRNRQFKQAIPVILQTTYEEISILWNQEAKYRPNFAVLDDRVMVPVICSKISGVKEESSSKYWEMVGKLVTEDTFVIKKAPFITPETPNPVRQYATSFLKEGKLQVQKIREHPSYPYGFIRSDMQDYMMDKLQKLLDSRVVRGTFTKGVEFTIVAAALNLDKNLLRLVQKYDFTKDIPKVIFINTAETLASLEDGILIAYLSMLGFDVLLCIPTGYQSVEQFYQKPLVAEHQAGDYIYDMRVPDYNHSAGAPYRDNIIGKIFKRGR